MIRLLLLVFSLGTASIKSQECLSRDYGNGGTVCVCNDQHCDSIPVVENIETPNFSIFTSNQDGLRFQKDTGTFMEPGVRVANEIVVKDDEIYQEILGWGGAFTDAASINIKSVNENLQQQILRSYFSEDGIQYSLCRVPIGGTDFSEKAYSYDDGPEDKNLTNFNLTLEDYDYKIPLIREAMNLSNDTLKFLASAWTAPKWMKFSGEYAGMFGFLKEEMYQTWADYFVKFLDSYSEEGIEFWGITTGNEPSLGFFPTNISSVAWTPWQMQTWVLNNLGPTIRQSNYSSIKILALDDQRAFLPWYMEILFANETAKDYIDGTSVHWYADKKYTPELLTRTHEQYPDKFILATEACKGDLPEDAAVELGSWERGEEYAFSVIEDVNHWVSGWIDWNMALDLSGGPTFIGNNVDSPIIVNATGGEFYKQPMFYVLGHFSKFVPRESVRISSTQFDDNVPVTAFKRPDGGVVVEILNKNNVTVSTVILDESRGQIELELTPRSLTTVLYW